MHKIKWLVSSLLVLGICFLFSTTAYGRVRGQLTGNNVRVRLTPSLESDSNILFQVSMGQTVYILDIAGDFYRVNVRDYNEVYIFREFISVVETIGVPEQNGIPVMSAPEAFYDVMGTRDIGASLHVTGRYGDWYEVRYNGERGFVESRLMSVELGDSLPTVRPPRGSFSSLGGALAEDIIAYAKTYIGTPYRFGSTDPSRGFDCSGFVTVVMRNFGIYLQRSSAAMAAHDGDFIERNSLEPGDLVFFATGGGQRISHVGIYIGNDQFIHSASCRGVIISGMNDPGYRGRYIRANRVF